MKARSSYIMEHMRTPNVLIINRDIHEDLIDDLYSYSSKEDLITLRKYCGMDVVLDEDMVGMKLGFMEVIK